MLICSTTDLLVQLSLPSHASPFIYLLIWTVLEIAQCHVTRMYCNCWCTLCIFESHFPSFWECFLSRHGPKLFQTASVVAQQPFSRSECTLRLMVGFCAAFPMIWPLSRSILFRPVHQRSTGPRGFFVRWLRESRSWAPPCPLSQGGNMAPQNKSAKDMHAQLSAWELLLGLPYSGSERFTTCRAYYCLSYIVKPLEIGLE